MPALEVSPAPSRRRPPREIVPTLPHQMLLYGTDTAVRSPRALCGLGTVNMAAIQGKRRLSFGTGKKGQILFPG